jgi:hypothetical protein
MSREKIGKIEKASHIGCLLINIFVFPGLGTLLGGKTRTGILQMSIFLFGFFLLFTTLGKLFFVSLFKDLMIVNPKISFTLAVIVYLGVPIMIASWIWGLVSGIKIVRNSFSKYVNRITRHRNDAR